jgi:hypothetical protein
MVISHLQTLNPFVQEFIVQRLRDAAGRHVLKEGGAATSGTGQTLPYNWQIM